MDSSDFNTRSSPIVTIRLFGTFSVDADGVPIQRFSTAKARALLAYLALNPDQPINRSVLATLLWPDTSDQNARDNLRNTLHRLRKTLANGVEGTVELLTATRQAVELHGATTQIDAVEFQHGLDAVANHEHAALDECPECLTVLEDAVALYREQFLAGLDIPDAEPFEEWMSLRREFFAHRVRHALAELIAAHEARGEYGRAQRFAEQYLVLDPLHEETHRSMMRLLARQDLPDLALSHHTALRERLQQELGVEPDSVTARLALEISQGTYAASAPVKPAGGASATAERIGAIKWGTRRRWQQSMAAKRRSCS